MPAMQELTQAQIDQARSQFAKEAGAKGGPARAKALTKKERLAIAIKANKARWKGHKKKVVA